MNALEASLERMGRSYVDVYQVTIPFRFDMQRSITPPYTTCLPSRRLSLSLSLSLFMTRATFTRYQVHFPFPYIGGNKALYEGLARCHERGLCNGVGVSNFNAKQVEVAYRELEKRGVPLVSNQVELSLCNQKALEDGTIDKVGSHHTHA